MLIGLAITSQFVSKLVEYLIPRLKAQRRRAREDNQAAPGELRPMSFYEKQTLLEPYDAQEDLFKEYRPPCSRSAVDLPFCP